MLRWAVFVICEIERLYLPYKEGGGLIKGNGY